MKTSTFAILIVIFIISVVIRLPNLNRPLSKHHEFCTAVALRVLQIWEEGGIANYDYNPVMSYPKEADKHINNYATTTGQMIDGQGNYYYVSHPPLAYYVTHYTFSLLGIYPSVLAIQVFHLLVHFVCGIGVYLLIGYGLKVTSCRFSWPALIGFVFYMFSPGTLWFQSNTYMSDLFVQVFFVFGILAVVKWSEQLTIGRQVIIALLVFLMTYTSWLGIFFAATLVLYVLVFERSVKNISLIILTSLGCLVATGLMAYQYSLINGWGAYVAEMQSRFAIRGNQAKPVLDILVILKNYLTSYLPLFLYIIALFGYIIWNRISFEVNNKKLLGFIFIIGLPVLLLHLALPNYSGHDFTTLYGSVLLAGITGFLTYAVLAKMSKRNLSALVLISVMLSIGQYYYINRPGEFSLKRDRYADFMEMGQFINAKATDDEVVFLQGMKPPPEMVLYAHRNIKQVNNEQDAMSFLEQHKKSKGIILIAEGQKISVLKRVAYP